MSNLPLKYINRTSSDSFGLNLDVMQSEFKGLFEGTTERVQVAIYVGLITYTLIFTVMLITRTVRKTSISKILTTSVKRIRSSVSLKKFRISFSGTQKSGKVWSKSNVIPEGSSTHMEHDDDAFKKKLDET